MSGSQAPDPPDGPGGLVVVIRDHPTQAARALAQDLQATLAVGGLAAEAALDALQPPEPGIDLAALGAAMRRAEAVRARTRSRAAVELARTINTELAIHPDTLRRAAAELIRASASLELARRGRPPGDARVGRRLRAGGTGGLTTAGVAIGALGALPAGAVVVAVGLIGGAASSFVARRAVLASVPGLEAAEAVARRRWEQVAGRGTDPLAVDAVVHRYDPHHRVVADLVGRHPAVRAADRAATIRRAAWVQAWRDEVGDTTGPPVLPDLEAALLAEQAAAPPAPAAAVPPPTLVVAAPYADLTDARARELHRRLLHLPAGPRVIVVLGPDSAADRGPVVDLTDPDEPTVDLTEGPPADQPAPSRRLASRRPG